MQDQDQILLENLYLEYINNPVGDREIEMEIERFKTFLSKYDNYFSFDEGGFDYTDSTIMMPHIQYAFDIGAKTNHLNKQFKAITDYFKGKYEPRGLSVSVEYVEGEGEPYFGVVIEMEDKEIPLDDRYEYMNNIIEILKELREFY
jgi:hypothetical protein